MGNPVRTTTDLAALLLEALDATRRSMLVEMAGAERGEVMRRLIGSARQTLDDLERVVVGRETAG